MSPKEAESLGAATLEAPGLARLESAGQDRICWRSCVTFASRPCRQESMLVFYAPRILEEGDTCTHLHLKGLKRQRVGRCSGQATGKCKAATPLLSVQPRNLCSFVMEALVA